ncbi:EamA family transporter RarD [Actinomyces glycerinitolerans]|uniref:Rard protein n=1 Tax=Actinomyces glycerinitolerans TaxID=1892869 RepID=A0A1M4S350_9ACTO|nr:EamA family transporter RarD [Actinomyces glycerinitolerans]SHE26437.1 rard protein [Actinomyces glycerinitolerans]
MTDSASPAPESHTAVATPAPARTAAGTGDTSGVAMVLGCYLLWGLFPLYFRLLQDAGSVEIIGHRLVWTLATCLGLTALRRSWPALRTAVATPRILGTLAASGLLVSVNWLVYVYAVNSGRTADAALGYFINPLVTVVLAAIFLGERLRRAQGVAVGIAVVAITVLVVAQGSLPWISLSLALSFGLYGLVKKRVGGRVDALTGLTVESGCMTPVALAYFAWLYAGGHGALQGTTASAGLAAGLVLAGPVTAAPLLLFAAGTRRVPLSIVGLSQYITPVMQFLLAWAVFHEEISPARWVSTALVWVAVVVFVTDLLWQLAHRPRPGKH